MAEPARKPFGSFVPAVAAKPREKARDKIDRSAFLYLPPQDRGDNNAQCKSCMMWFAELDRCIIHPADVEIGGDDSCGLYMPGKPARKGKPMGLVTPKESGLVSRQVRCENCAYADGGYCGLFEMLNSHFPTIFDLDAKIDKHGCCNAQTKK